MTQMTTPRLRRTPPTEGNLPQLRFPEFKDLGVWEIFSIADLCECGLANGVFNDPKKVGKGYKLINVIDMYIETSIQEGSLTLLELSETEFTKNKVNYGDIFFTRSSLVKSGIAYSNIYLGCSNDVTYDGHLIRFRVDQKKINSLFANYILRTNNVREQLVARGKSATMTTIGQADVASVNLCIPLILPEQQKIAACLSSLDDLITAENQQLEALKTHKKGLMQSLFPAEGETVPKFRFPEFKDAGEWEEKPFKEIAKFLSGGTPSKDVPEYWEGTIPWISASSMHSTKIEKSDSNITFLAVSDGARMVDKGTLLLLVRGSMLHKRIPIGITETTVSFNQDVKAIVLKGDVSERYLMSFLIASESKLLAAVTATGIGAGKLDTNDLNDLLIKFPSRPEQQKIAACLSSLDDLISAQSQKIEALKQHKKGLMQQLFPNANLKT